MMYSGRTVIVESDGGSKMFTLPKAAVWEPDPGDIYVERGLLDTQGLLAAVETVANYSVDAVLSFYHEERTIETDGFVKHQRMGFYVLQFQENSRFYIYADYVPEKLKELCIFHMLPHRVVFPNNLPILLSPNVVGHIFHEWVHLLELDFLGYETALSIKNLPIFGECVDLQIFEDPKAETIGFNAFNDDARITRQIPIVEQGRIVGFIDSSAYPCHYLGCGYLGYNLGYNNSAFPIPRTTNLVIQARPIVYESERALVITELDLELLNKDPVSTRIRIKNCEGVYIERGMPIYRVNWKVGIETTVQELVCSMIFLNSSNIHLTVVGGICVKNGIAVRSAQSAPPVLLDGLLGKSLLPR